MTTERVLLWGGPYHRRHIEVSVGIPTWFIEELTQAQHSTANYTALLPTRVPRTRYTYRRDLYNPKVFEYEGSTDA